LPRPDKSGLAMTEKDRESITPTLVLTPRRGRRYEEGKRWIPISMGMTYRETGMTDRIKRA